MSENAFTGQIWCFSCKLLRELLSLDLYTRTVVYPLLIKGWSQSGENVVPNRFRTFISIYFRNTYIFAVSKIGLA